jgi:hypothetical protein
MKSQNSSSTEKSELPIIDKSLQTSQSTKTIDSTQIIEKSHSRKSFELKIRFKSTEIFYRNGFRANQTKMEKRNSFYNNADSNWFRGKSFYYTGITVTSIITVISTIEQNMNTNQIHTKDSKLTSLTKT